MPNSSDIFKELDERLFELKNPGYLKAKKRQEKIDSILKEKQNDIFHRNGLFNRILNIKTYFFKYIFKRK
jgi:predicted nucleic acid-binding protein